MTETIPFSIWKLAFTILDSGHVSAAAYLLLSMIQLLTNVLIWLMGRQERRA